jgi:hypothetical protein
MMEADNDNNMLQDSIPGPVLDGDFVAEVYFATIRGPGKGPGEVNSSEDPTK